VKVGNVKGLLPETGKQNKKLSGWWKKLSVLTAGFFLVIKLSKPEAKTK
jgi:hypothetical protein